MNITEVGPEYKKKFEPEAVLSQPEEHTYRVCMDRSIAISLKRIADALTEGGCTGFPLLTILEKGSGYLDG